MGIIRQMISNIKPEDLISNVQKLHEKEFRLVQICCTISDGYEITYTFEKRYNLFNLRLNVETQTQIESISQIYSYAFLYENEMKDLFGVKIVNMTIDFAGKLYKTAIETPFLNNKEKPE